jgi:exodeoxyribonuclease VII large subunit
VPVSLESRARRLVDDHGAPDALTVSELYDQVDRAVRGAFPEAVWVMGEVRSMKVLTKGHCFLDLVDPAQADDPGAPTLSAKCWAGTWRSIRVALERLGITLEAGMVVRVRGEVSLYKARGSVDFVVRELDTEALLGRVAAERARLVRALVDEDLYDRQRRLPVPALPLRVGLVASPGTEGYRDFLGGLEGSGLAFDVLVAPTTVQGKDAPARAAAAIGELQRRPIDMIVVVRGGGSKADLGAFDQEVVARAIATSHLPVWTGIGHTGDHAVADEVANRAFITPTECGQELARVALDFWRGVEEAGVTVSRLAREAVLRADKTLAAHQRAMATGARIQLDRHTDGLGHRARHLRTVVRGQVDTHAQRLAVAGMAAGRAARRATLDERVSLARRTARLAGLPARRLEVEELRVGQRRRLLGAYDYQRQLERGYTVTRDASGAVLRSIEGLAPGAALVTQLADGTVDSTVTATTTKDMLDTMEGTT